MKYYGITVPFSNSEVRRESTWKKMKNWRKYFCIKDTIEIARNKHVKPDKEDIYVHNNACRVIH